MAYEAHTSDFKISASIFAGSTRVSGHVPEAQMFPRLISNSGKRKIGKNQFVNFLEFFEIFDEVFFLDFDFTEWAELAVI